MRDAGARQRLVLQINEWQRVFVSREQVSEATSMEIQADEMFFDVLAALSEGEASPPSSRNRTVNEGGLHGTDCASTLTAIPMRRCDCGADVEAAPPPSRRAMLEYLASDTCRGNRHEAYLGNCPVCVSRLQRLEGALVEGETSGALEIAPGVFRATTSSSIFTEGRAVPDLRGYAQHTMKCHLSCCVWRAFPEECTWNEGHVCTCGLDALLAGEGRAAPEPETGPRIGHVIEAAAALHAELVEYCRASPAPDPTLRHVLEKHIGQAMRQFEPETGWQPIRAMVATWRAKAIQADRWAGDEDSRGDGVNSYAHLKERRIWTTCADELAAALPPPPAPRTPA